MVKGYTYKLTYRLLRLSLFTRIRFSFNVCHDGLSTVSLGHTNLSLSVLITEFRLLLAFSLLCDPDKLYIILSYYSFFIEISWFLLLLSQWNKRFFHG